jgi:hypothetical protein
MGAFDEWAAKQSGGQGDKPAAGDKEPGPFDKWAAKIPPPPPPPAPPPPGLIDQAKAAVTGAVSSALDPATATGPVERPGLTRNPRLPQWTAPEQQQDVLSQPSAEGAAAQAEQTATPAPVSKEMAAKARAALAAMPPADRKLAEQLPGWRGDLAKALNGQLDSQQQGEGTVTEMGRRADSAEKARDRTPGEFRQDAGNALLEGIVTVPQMIANVVDPSAICDDDCSAGGCRCAGSGSTATTSSSAANAPSPSRR